MKKIWPFLIATPVIFLGAHWLRTPSESAEEAFILAPSSRMEEAVLALLSSLDAQQSQQAQFSFDHAERVNWNYVPIERKGLPLKRLNPSQRDLVYDILKTAMSAEGIQRVEGIMQLEGILRELEGLGPNSTYRDPDKYYFSLFGNPSGQDAWGWRFEGHHLSLNFTAAGDALVSATPAFMGSNPARVPTGPRKGWRVLEKEEELGRALASSLDANQRTKAIFNSTAPSEIVTGSERRAVISENLGVAYADLNPGQQEMLMGLIKIHLGRFNSSIQEEQLQKLKKHGMDKVLFAWAGSLKPMEGHYYRIHAVGFLIEYDNTQNGANHIHTVWRGFENDFGEDILAKHYQNNH